MSEWLKVMLEEIARKQAEADGERAEPSREPTEQAPPPDPRPG